MRWLAQSSDLNPIEHLRDMLGRPIRQPPNTPESFDDLRTAMVQLWEGMD